MAGYAPRYMTADRGAMQKYGPRGWLKLDRCSVRKAWLGGCRVRGRHAAEPDHTATASMPRCKSGFAKELSPTPTEDPISSTVRSSTASEPIRLWKPSKAREGASCGAGGQGPGTRASPRPPPQCPLGTHFQRVHPVQLSCQISVQPALGLAVAPSPQSLRPAAGSKASVTWRCAWGSRRHTTRACALRNGLRCPMQSSAN